MSARGQMREDVPTGTVVAAPNSTEGVCAVAGEDLHAGDWVRIDPDGRAWRSEGPEPES